MTEEKKSVELSDLVGEHDLTGVDSIITRVPEYEGSTYLEDSEAFTFVLDGVAYTAVENPSDGYRSSMRDIFVSHQFVKNTFAPCRVLGRMRTQGEYGETDEILELIDVKTGKTVIEVGTRNVDDYYPSFKANFSPENMAANATP